MGRPPCCDKVGIKKGPWTPEEDIILVSYIQEHGPGNWRSVPTNTGLLRCSKSCRLRWTNYLRPGIKRGNFTPHEEGMIIHLQALLGNKWAAIASYLPQRTDNDIKNYWNTHLKKKLKKFHSTLDPLNNNINNIHIPCEQSSSSSIHNLTSQFHASNKSTTINNNSLIITTSTDQTKTLNSTNSPNNNSSSSATYASSTENISRLLEGWMKSSPKTRHNHRDSLALMSSENHVMVVKKKEEKNHVDDLKFESMLSFENPINNNKNDDNNNNNNNVVVSSWERSSTCSDHDQSTTPSHNNKGNNNNNMVAAVLEDHDHDRDNVDDHDDDDDDHVMGSLCKSGITTEPPQLSFLEKWLLDESSTSATVAQVDEMIELSQMF